MRWGIGWLVACLAISASAGAQAGGKSEPAQRATTAPDATAPVASGWYGWQILATDAASIAVGLGVGAASGDEGNRRFGDTVGTAWGLGMVGSLSVHAAHESAGRALAGVGYRALVPPTVALVGLGFGCLLSGIADHCASDSARWGFVLGALGTSALDVGLLAYPRRATEPRSWYGWQSLVIDGASLTAGAIVTVRRDEPDRRKRIGGLAVLPYVTGLLISPWVHVFHGRWGTALGSLALRAFAPALGALVGLAGYCAATGGTDECTADGAVYGLLGGTVLTAGIDIGLLSHERSEPAHASTTGAVMPYLTPHQDGLRSGISGTF
jgi:hypothetical protein